ncbi:dethiobiotin synthase [Edaphovirga cremea]|uniref:dethiobiotin synthase n=1 Tax=Edaphovirga cremea TaxID=2267246 RepID=UPI00398950F0
MSNRWFVTGTDTEVGKTVASCALLQAAAAMSFLTAGYKPVASGSEMTPEGARNSDALALQANSRLPMTYADVNPFTFIEPTSPHIVSVAEGRSIDLVRMSQGLQHLEQRAEWILVEGAGGWYTPLSEQRTFADWVVSQQLPVILVVGIKLGCINHAMLTAEAIQQRGLRLGGWIANDIQPVGRRHQEYMATLTREIKAPLLGEIPYLAEPERQNLGQYLDLSPLS